MYAIYLVSTACLNIEIVSILGKIFEYILNFVYSFPKMK